MLTTLLLQAAAVAAPASPPPDVAAFEAQAWGRVSRSTALRHSREEITIGRMAAGRTYPVPVRVRLVTQEPLTKIDTVHWTGPEACPAAATLARRFAAVPLPARTCPTSPPPATSSS